jgi:hypothetical protein
MNCTLVTNSRYTVTLCNGWKDEVWTNEKKYSREGGSVRKVESLQDNTSYNARVLPAYPLRSPPPYWSAAVQSRASCVASHVPSTALVLSSRYNSRAVHSVVGFRKIKYRSPNVMVSGIFYFYARKIQKSYYFFFSVKLMFRKNRKNTNLS